jgi:hypothetical protein
MIFARIIHFLQFSENQRKRKTVYTERELATVADARGPEVLTGADWALKRQKASGLILRTSRGLC